MAFSASLRPPVNARWDGLQALQVKRDAWSLVSYWFLGIVCCVSIYGSALLQEMVYMGPCVPAQLCAVLSSACKHAPLGQSYGPDLFLAPFVMRSVIMWWLVSPSPVRPGGEPRHT